MWELIQTQAEEEKMEESEKAEGGCSDAKDWRKCPQILNVMGRGGGNNIVLDQHWINQSNIWKRNVGQTPILSNNERSI